MSGCACGFDTLIISIRMMLLRWEVDFIGELGIENREE